MIKILSIETFCKNWVLLDLTAWIEQEDDELRVKKTDQEEREKRSD